VVGHSQRAPILYDEKSKQNCNETAGSHGILRDTLSNKKASLTNVKEAFFIYLNNFMIRVSKAINKYDICTLKT